MFTISNSSSLHCWAGDVGVEFPFPFVAATGGVDGVWLAVLVI